MKKVLLGSVTATVCENTNTFAPYIHLLHISALTEIPEAANDV